MAVVGPDTKWYEEPKSAAITGVIKGSIKAINGRQPGDHGKGYRLRDNNNCSGYSGDQIIFPIFFGQG
ncbi:MAG: hypothetical protein U5K51_00625 [Flavobacteriaceae bacterium]|nr:hypothetical protein [Flavobacteriaceae bacterium]